MDSRRPHAGPLARFNRELAPARRREPVVPRAAAELGHRPFGLYPSTVLEAMERWIQRALGDPQHVIGDLLDSFRNHPSVQGVLLQRPEDKHAVKVCLRDLAARVKDGEFDDVSDGLRHNPLLTAWQVFRQSSVTRLVQRLQSSIRERGDALDLWLDLWPPAYSWLLGQDYASLTRISRVLKHFPYHKLGGGADVQGLITHLASDAGSRERAFAAFKTLFDLPFALTYQEFTEHGFPIEFVRHQNDRVRQLVQPGTFVYSGIQMWNLPPTALIDAIDAADASACDDVIYYCYGWADDALFAAAARRRSRHLESRKDTP